MKNKKRVPEIKKQINYSFEKLVKLQEEMLFSKKMIGASLIKRHLGTRKQKRVSHAFYLSISKNGKTKLKYIPKNRVRSVEIQVVEWKKYQQDLRRWRQLTESIWQDLKELGKIQNQLEQK